MRHVRMNIFASAAMATAACAEFSTPSSIFACDDERRCEPGFACASLPEVGWVCLTDAEYRVRCERPERCNAYDDDCDGTTDEEWPEIGDPCVGRTGVCEGPRGTTVCADDGAGVRCDAEAPVSSDETCNGFDDDCDGVTDNDIADIVTGVTLGACVARVERCVNGAFAVVEEGRMPSDEECNGLDDDCDGLTDNNVDDRITGITLGECVAHIERCMGGVFTVFEAGVFPAEELCNTLDDDCDGGTDEGVPPIITGSSVGECRTTVAVCEDGAPSVILEGVTPTEDTCDNLDNNCDGETDEAYPFAGQACMVGIGACTAIGVSVCSDDRAGVVCNAVELPPTAERCNGLDDDCDGFTDEIFTLLGDTCVVGIGRCATAGTMTCTEDGSDTTCDAVALDPVLEECNGLDDDCDGVTDWVGSDCCAPDMVRACGITLGQCTVGEQRCGADRRWGACSGVGASFEECDDVDNDCDGETDDGITCACVPERSRPCSVTRGECREGTQVCGADAVWGACSGVLPGVETCNNRDDNCDGVTDDPWPLWRTPCTVGIGACAREGRFQCAAAANAVVCDAVVGFPAEETCNLIDDDCDGNTDEDLVTRTGSNVGICREGIQRCANGAFTQEQIEVPPTVETCNGFDDDCDGATDEDAQNCCDPGPPVQSRACGFARGECTVGAQECRPDRTWGACSGTLPVEERCNGLDDDCDGATDDVWRTRVGLACTVSRGICARSSTYRCADDGSDLECPVAAGVPADEICNGLDDDCDGYMDEPEDVPTEVAGTDEGICRPQVRACLDGAWSVVQSGITPADEICNGLDDDCDGEADNGYARRDCFEGPFDAENVGVCVAGGTVCIDGREICAGQVLPGYEVCNGLDDDCDGVADGAPDADGNPIALAQECYTGPAGTVGVGECLSGYVECTDGIWGACVGDILPEPESCDDLDNDCDGTTDEPSISDGTFNPDTNTWVWEDSFERSDLPPWIVRPDSIDPPIVGTRAFDGVRSLSILSADGGFESLGAVQRAFEGCFGSATLDIRIYVASWDEAYADIYTPLFLTSPGGYFAFLNRTQGYFARADGSTFSFAHALTLNEWVSIRISIDADAYVLYEAGVEVGRIAGGRASGIEIAAGQGPGGTERTEVLVDDIRFSGRP